jgi:sugar phosphate isomerase/epimerase
MRLGIFAKTFPQVGARAVLGAVQAAGYERTQFNLSCLGLPSMPDGLESSIPASIAQASQATGVAIAALSGSYNMVHPDLNKRARGRASLALLIQSARAMGTRLVTLCTGSRDPEDQWRFHPDNSSPQAWSDLLQELGVALAIAEAEGVDLGIEPELGNVVSSPELARKLLDTLNSKCLKIVLDPANLFEHGTTELSRELNARAIDLLADRIVMAHAKDRKADGSFAAAGKGVIDFGHFVAALQDAGFSGDMVAHGLGAAEVPEVTAFLRGILNP